METITPTVGRKVWYYANNGQDEPIDATVIKVHGEPSPRSPVNLFIVGPEGDTFTKTEVVVGDEFTEGTHYRWMPYQRQQASKDSTASVAGAKL